MQSGVEGERLLGLYGISTAREYQIPAMDRNGARHDNNPELGEQRVPELLLTGAGRAGAQPVGIRNDVGRHDMDTRRVGDLDRCEDMRNGVEGLKAGVDGDLQDRGGGIDGAIDGGDSPARPSAAETSSALPTVPGRAEIGLVQAPRDQSGAAEHGG